MIPARSDCSQKIWAVLTLIALCTGPSARSQADVAGDDAGLTSAAATQRDLGAETWSNWELTPALLELLAPAR